MNISIGVVMRLLGEEATDALARADHLTYDAIRLGRNGVEASPAPGAKQTCPACIGPRLIEVN